MIFKLVLYMNTYLPMPIPKVDDNAIVLQYLTTGVLVLLHIKLLSRKHETDSCCIDIPSLEFVCVYLIQYNYSRWFVCVYLYRCVCVCVCVCACL